MEVVIKEASKLLSNCKAGNIVKELKKLKEKDTASLEAANKTLQSEVEQLKMVLALKEDEVREFKAHKMEALTEIREMVINSSDVLNKANFFDNYINKEVKITMPKVIAILHGFHKKMEAFWGRSGSWFLDSLESPADLLFHLKRKHHRRRSYWKR